MKGKRTYTAPPLPNAIKVGRLTWHVARKIGRKCADIYLTDEAIEHIEERHGTELSQLAIGAEEYVSGILKHFNRIYDGGNGALMLARHKDTKHDVAVIDLVYIPKRDVWKIATAQPREDSRMRNKKLLWRKDGKKKAAGSAHPPGVSGKRPPTAPPREKTGRGA